MNTAWTFSDARTRYTAGTNSPMLVVSRPYDGQPATSGNGSRIGLMAPTHEAAQAVHAEALELRGTDEGGPGFRSRDPGDLYRAYVRDPDGNKLMIFASAPS